MLNIEDYTKRKHITKALEFELIPQGKTLETISKKGDKEYDKAIYASLERLKPVIDSFIKDISKKALKGFDYDFTVLAKAYTDKDRKTITKEEKNLTKALLKKIDDTLPDKMKVSQINSAAFLQDTLREYVMYTADESIRKDEALKDIEETKGCLSLFSKYLTTRITALTTWMPERVLENLRIFMDNAQKIEDMLLAGSEVVGSYEDELRLMKSLSYYTHVLSQPDIDGYNLVVSGKVGEDGIIEKGINVLVNEYNTEVKNKKLDKKFLRKLKALYKQILMPSEKQFTIPFISTDDEVRVVIKDAYDSFKASSKEMVSLLDEKAASSNGEGIVIKGNNLHRLSFYLTGDHKAITERLANEELITVNEMLKKKDLPKTVRKELEKKAENIQSYVVKRSYELSELDEFIVSADKSILYEDKSVMCSYVQIVKKLVKEADMYYKLLEDANILKGGRIKGARDKQELIAAFFSSLADVRSALSLIQLPKDTESLENYDILFYDRFDEVYEGIRLTFKAENLVRNYVTKSVKEIAKKVQTCFGTPARLRAQWWNGEKKFSREHAAIIKHDGKYYYFILAGDSKPVDIKETGGETGFLTMKKGQKSFMMLPKILFTDRVVPFFENNKEAAEYIISDESVVRPIRVSRSLYDIYKGGLFKKDAINAGTITEEEYKQNIAKLIAKYTEFANVYVQYQKFNLDGIDDPEKYNDIGEFFAEVDTRTSSLSWTMIDFKQIENLVETESAYLFLISNKFLYKEAGNKSAYTKTFLSILSDENMERVTILLNSNPSVYFRPQALEKKITHKKGSIMVNKRTEDGEHIPQDIYEAIYKMKNGMSSVSEEDEKKAKEYEKTHRVRSFVAKYDKTYRGNYMQDKYILQLSYTKNNDISDRTMDMLNDRVNESIKEGYNIISVSRSVKDMIYCMVLDDKLKVLKELSLNTIDGIDYYALLHDTYSQKKEDRKAWVYDTENANLKSAYIDRAITEILKLSQEYNAVIVIESIPDKVKEKYAFLDNQVFRAFENRIAQRLSDLTYKKATAGTPGSVNNPLQLSNNSGSSYQDGILYIVNGAYTRGVDPESGFVNLFDFYTINSIGQKRKFFASMEDIRYTGDAIELTFDYSKYQTRVETKKTNWKVRITGDAIVFDKEKQMNVRIPDIVNDKIIPLAGKTKLDGNLAPRFLEKDIPGAFVDELYKWFRYTLTGNHAKYRDKESFYRSPINSEEYDHAQIQAYNLAKKLQFRMHYEGDSKDFTKDWLNSLQMV